MGTFKFIGTESSFKVSVKSERDSLLNRQLIRMTMISRKLVLLLPNFLHANLNYSVIFAFMIWDLFQYRTWFSLLSIFSVHQTNAPIFLWSMVTLTAVDFVVFFPGLCLFNSLGHGAVTRLWKPEGHDTRDNSENAKYDQWKRFAHTGKISLKRNYGCKIT